MFFAGTELIFGSEAPTKIKRKKVLIAKNEIRKAKIIIKHTPAERANNRLRGIKEEALS